MTTDPVFVIVESASIDAPLKSALSDHVTIVVVPSFPVNVPIFPKSPTLGLVGKGVSEVGTYVTPELYATLYTLPSVTKKYLVLMLLTDSIMEGRRKFEDSNIAEMARLHEEELEAKESKDKETSEKIVEETIKEDTLKEKEEKRIKPVKRKTYKPQSPKSE